MHATYASGQNVLCKISIFSSQQHKRMYLLPNLRREVDMALRAQQENVAVTGRFLNMTLFIFSYIHDLVYSLRSDERSNSAKNLNAVGDDYPPEGAMTDPKPAGGMTE